MKKRKKHVGGDSIYDKSEDTLEGVIPIDHNIFLIIMLLGVWRTYIWDIYILRDVDLKSRKWNYTFLIFSSNYFNLNYKKGVLLLLLLLS